MSEPGHHCPFLNRADARCASYFSLERLGYALGHCFGEYQPCSVYQQILRERLSRRLTGTDHEAEQPHEPGPRLQLTIARYRARQAA